MIGKGNLASEGTNRDNGCLADFLADVGPIKEFEDGWKDEVVVLFDAQTKSRERMEYLYENFMPTRVGQIAVERAKNLLEDSGKERLELALDGTGDNFDELDDNRLERRVVPVFKNEREDRVEKVSNVELDDRNERPELSEPWTLVGRRAPPDGRDEGRDDL